MPFVDFAALDALCHELKLVVARWAKCECPQFAEGRPMYADCRCPPVVLARPLTPKEKADRRKKRK